MPEVRFEFEGVHAEPPAPADDLSAIYDIVADRFEIAVGDTKLFAETDFPIVELADSLDAWLRRQMPNRQEFAFEPTGYAETGALQLRPSNGERWTVDSCQRPASDPAPRVNGVTLESAVKRFLGCVSAECVSLGIDLDGLLDRMRAYSEQDEERKRGR